MSREVIAFIVEGEKTEKKIIDNIKTNFFFEEVQNKHFIFLSFRADIYQLYQKLKADDFETDIIELIIERQPEIQTTISSLEKGKMSISQKYLFFDYDGQACKGSGGDIIIKEMIEFFTDETEDGKIYVSYPMVESIKDLKKQDICSRSCAVPAKHNIHYKSLVATDTDFPDLGSLKMEDWYLILEKNIKKANCLICSSFVIPQFKDYIRNMNQHAIFENQVKKFINVDNTIAVLAGFPFFIIDYFGEPLFCKICEDGNDRVQNICNKISK